MEIINKKELMQKNEYTKIEEQYIYALNKALQKNGIPENYYSLYGYRDSCVCIQKLNGQWIVFEGEREIRFNEVGYDSLIDACAELINRVADKSTVEKVRLDFYDLSIFSCVIFEEPYGVNRRLIPSKTRYNGVQRRLIPSKTKYNGVRRRIISSKLKYRDARRSRIPKELEKMIATTIKARDKKRKEYNGVTKKNNNNI